MHWKNQLDKNPIIKNGKNPQARKRIFVETIFSLSEKFPSTKPLAFQSSSFFDVTESSLHFDNKNHEDSLHFHLAFSSELLSIEFKS